MYRLADLCAGRALSSLRKRGEPMSALLGPGYLWLGPNAAEALAAYTRARAAGMNAVRSLVIGCVASFRDAWAFRKTIAERVKCSVRTVQRALNQGRKLGLIQVWRAKKGEIPKGLSAPMKCGWSHRIAVGFGQAAAVVAAAVAAARVKFMLRHPPSVAPKLPAPTLPASCQPVADNRVLSAKPRTANQLRRWTAEEIEAELARIERARAALDSSDPK